MSKRNLRNELRKIKKEIKVLNNEFSSNIKRYNSIKEKADNIVSSKDVECSLDKIQDRLEDLSKLKTECNIALEEFCVVVNKRNKLIQKMYDIQNKIQTKKTKKCKILSLIGVAVVIMITEVIVKNTSDKRKIDGGLNNE